MIIFLLIIIILILLIGASRIKNAIIQLICIAIAVFIGGAILNLLASVPIWAWVLIALIVVCAFAVFVLRAQPSNQETLDNDRYAERYIARIHAQRRAETEKRNTSNIDDTPNQ